jgi:hypothetical protein
MPAIPLNPPHRGFFAIVDEGDAEWLTRWKWSVRQSGDASPYAFRRQRENGKVVQIWMHREILGLPHAWQHSSEGDHVNCDTLDNRRSNLRIATHRGNSQNLRRRERVSPGSRNVYLMKSGRWRVSAMLNGKKLHLGYFAQEADAERIAAQFRHEFFPSQVPA